MEVFLANEQDLPVDEDRIAALAGHVLTSEGVDEDTELSVLLISSDHMRRLNARFAGDDYATDVLAFPMLEDDDSGAWLLGDVVVCPQVGQTNAAKLGRSLQDELDTLVVHGVLHLLGYDHQGPNDSSKMDGRLRDIVASFGSTTV